MTNKQKVTDKIVDGFQQLKGKASVYCFTKDIIPFVLREVIYKFTAKRTSSKIFIIVDSYTTRKSILDYIDKNPIHTVYTLSCLSDSYVKQEYRYINDLAILVGVNDKLDVINKINIESKFTLCIFTKNIMNNEFINNVRRVLPCIDLGELTNAVNNDKIYSPVEEHRCRIDLINDSDRPAYDKYTDFINTSITIFGSLEVIEYCRNGIEKENISAVQFRNEFANENGWNDQLDTSVPYLRQIDDIYNPNALLERANLFYSISRKRRDLCSSAIDKLEVIADIVKNNIDKKILIVSKNGEFASKITKYINENISDICRNYHDCIEDSVAVDSLGNVIRIKSGAKKGQPKILCHQAQSSLNEALFNNGSINVLSIKNSSNTKLKIACDLVILTSTLYSNIIDVKKRFVNVKFDDINTIVYRLYCAETIEQTAIENEKTYSNIKVVEEQEKFIGYDENSNCIIL